MIATEAAFKNVRELQQNREKPHVRGQTVTLSTKSTRGLAWLVTLATDVGSNPTNQLTVLLKLLNVTALWESWPYQEGLQTTEQTTHKSPTAHQSKDYTGGSC